MRIVEDCDLMARDRRVLNNLMIMAQDVTPVRGAKIASAMVYKNSIISFGINQFRSHPLQAKFGKNSDAIFLHSEIDCIRNAVNRHSASLLNRSTLFIYRARRFSGGKSHWCSGSASPCSGCTKAIAAFDIRRVVASTDSPGIYEVWESQ